jgi:hypothetical protein
MLRITPSSVLDGKLLIVQSLPLRLPLGCLPHDHSRPRGQRQAHQVCGPGEQDLFLFAHAQEDRFGFVHTVDVYLMDMQVKGVQASGRYFQHVRFMIDDGG